MISVNQFASGLRYPTHNGLKINYVIFEYSVLSTYVI